jgi:diguanylate cyclase (GGDEF)-like protein
LILFAQVVFFMGIPWVWAQLKHALDQQRELARTDPLTGLANRRAFVEAATLELKRAQRYNHPVTAAYLDVDDFKLVNDRYGYHAGDRLLQVVANTLKKNVRAMDLIARLGGDEFFLLFPETGDEPGLSVLRKLENSLAEAMRRNSWPATVSIGAMTFIQQPDSVELLIALTDRLMYAAKGQGKNQTVHQGAGNAPNSYPHTAHEPGQA